MYVTFVMPTASREKKERESNGTLISSCLPRLVSALWCGLMLMSPLDHWIIISFGFFFFFPDCLDMSKLSMLQAYFDFFKWRKCDMGGKMVAGL